MAAQNQAVEAMHQVGEEEARQVVADLGTSKVAEADPKDPKAVADPKDRGLQARPAGGANLVDPPRPLVVHPVAAVARNLQAHLAEGANLPARPARGANNHRAAEAHPMVQGPCSKGRPVAAVQVLVGVHPQAAAMARRVHAHPYRVHGPSSPSSPSSPPAASASNENEIFFFVSEYTLDPQASHGAHCGSSPTVARAPAAALRKCRGGLCK